MNRRVRVVASVVGLCVAACGRNGSEPAHPAGHAAHEKESAPTGAPSQVPPDRVEVAVPFERRQMLGVRTAPVERRALVHEIRTVGLVGTDERRVRKVQSKVSGWVESLSLSFTGEFVKAGAPILSVYSPELVASQREYLLALEAAPQSRDAGEAARGFQESALLRDSARNRLLRWDLTPAQVEKLERSRQVERAVTLHAPIGGFVTFKPVYQGMYITPEMELYTIADLSQVWIWADLTEEESSLVDVGMHAKIELASQPGAPLEAVVRFVSPVLDASTRTVRVRFDAPNPAGVLKPGMYATVRLEKPLGEVVALPDEAIIDTGQRKVVFVELEPGRYQPRAVELGRRGGGAVEVLSGLAPGERVVVSAQFLLDSESRLRAAGGGSPTHGAH
jgi:Cu(I)/Ag(I) efflux system membrane fusion protein